ncbi:MAG: zinc ABC transporter substrate-binding protein, partial [Pseudomonadota bacterium]|nr:zinc ABC transporter substrate-binding protein [Pseudomonadota bacterium]
KVKTLGAHCVFSEPQFQSRIITTVITGTNTRAGVLDPIGMTLETGSGLYAQLLRNLALELRACLQ